MGGFEASGDHLVINLDSPRERVWAAGTEPERLADWYGGPDADNPMKTATPR